MSEITPPRFLATSEAANYLGVAPQTLRQWRSRGGGPPYLRLGDGPAARCCYRLEALEQWVAAHTFNSTAAAFAHGAAATGAAE